MRRVFLCIVGVCVLLYAGSLLQAEPQQRPKSLPPMPSPAQMTLPIEDVVAWLPADRAIPPTLVVRKEVPETTLICVEPPTGTVICRTVAVFREWMQTSTAERMKK